MPLAGRVAHGTRRTLAVVERIAPPHRLVEDPHRLHLRALGPHLHRAGLVLHGEDRLRAATVDPGPAGLADLPGLPVALAVGVGLRLPARPLLLHRILGPHALAPGEEALYRCSNHRPPRELHLADEHALGLRRRRVHQEPQPSPRPEHEPAEQQRERQGDQPRGPDDFDGHRQGAWRPALPSPSPQPAHATRRVVAGPAREADPSLGRTHSPPKQQEPETTDSTDGHGSSSDHLRNSV